MSITSPQDPSDIRTIFTPALLLMGLAFVMQMSFAPWMLMINNYAIEELAFTGREIGLQHTIREIPGFLSFAAVFLLLWAREQSWAYITLLLLGAGGAATGLFPTLTGYLIITFVASVGFHYYETMHQSLSLQWLPKANAAATMGKILSVGSVAQLIAYGMVFAATLYFAASYSLIFAITGLITVAGAVLLWALFPSFDQGAPQRAKPVLRKRYWLFYLLTFMGGARRQIFMVFAGFMLVEKFGFSLDQMALLAIANVTMTIFVAPIIGRMIVKIGERNVLIIEYVGLAFVFASYAFVEVWQWAIALYLLDHALFAMAIAIKTYFQKIADPADIAPTAAVAFTINHIAAVFIPVLFGFIWIWSPAIVFLIGAAMAGLSFVFALLVPLRPSKGNELIWGKAAR